MEIEIAEWALDHKDDILHTIEHMKTEASVNPILASFYKEAVVNEIVFMVADGMNLDYESVACVIDTPFLERLYGDKFVP